MSITKAWIKPRRPAPTSSLVEIYKRHSGPGKFNDKGTVHSYVETYEELLAPYRNTAQYFLEIGLFDGHSMRMWEEYFGQQCDVCGIDCDEQPHGGLADLRPMIKECEHYIYIFDATNDGLVEKNFGGLKFDVIIDDAAHNLEQQLELIKVWLPRMTPGSIYIVEDLQSVDTDRKHFEDRGFQIIDLRHKKGRYDDVIAVRRN